MALAREIQVMFSDWSLNCHTIASFLRHDRGRSIPPILSNVPCSRTDYCIITTVRDIRDELSMLYQHGSSVGEVVKPMGKDKVLVKMGGEGKYVVGLDKEIKISQCTPGARVALRSDSMELHKILPTKVDPLVSLMRVENVPDATYDMVGGLDKQI